MVKWNVSEGISSSWGCFSDRVNMNVGVLLQFLIRVRKEITCLKSLNRLVTVIKIDCSSGVWFSLHHFYSSGWTILGWVQSSLGKHLHEMFICFQHWGVSFPLAAAQEPHSELGSACDFWYIGNLYNSSKEINFFREEGGRNFCVSRRKFKKSSRVQSLILVWWNRSNWEITSLCRNSLEQRVLYEPFASHLSFCF